MRRPSGKITVKESDSKRQARLDQARTSLQNAAANERAMKLEMIETTDMSAVRFLAKGNPQTISEADFVRVFLPMFHAKFNEPVYTREEIERMQYDNPNGLAPEIHAWLSVAKQPYNEVHVVAANGEILFTVPAMFQTKNLNIRTKNDRPTIASITAQLSNEVRYNPMMAAQNFNTRLQGALVKSDQGAKASDIVDFWNGVFKRYGLSLIKIDKAEPSESAQKDVPKNEEKLFDNDDW